MPINTGYRVLIADDEEGLRFVLRELLTREGCRVEEAEDGSQAVEMARNQPYDLYLLDMMMPRMDGLEALRKIRSIYPQALAVMITAYGTQNFGIEALKAGAFDYFTKPFDIDELRIILLRALEKQSLLRKINQLQMQLEGRSQCGRMIGQSPAMRHVYQMIDRVAEHDVTVLVTGESGTGKELVARAIHEQSPRQDAPFVTVNCAAIPEPLLESELFGHERGAFTGATHSKAGKFEVAGGGTILLDEIGEMPLAIQAKLLRVLQEHEIERVGSNQPQPVDIRVIAATNRDLSAMVEDKAFREDLFFRINVVPIHLPPLRQRPEDVAVLTHFFIREFAARFGKNVDGLTPEAMALIERYRWPGNVRELENVLQRALVMAGGSHIIAEDLPDNIRGLAKQVVQPALMASVIGCGADDDFDFNLPLASRIEELVDQEERRIIQAALARTEGRQETADLLGISRKSLHNKMLKYSLFDR